VARLLENKVVIVAGLGGIGNGLARRYADEGALLVVGDLDAALAVRVADDIDPSGERVRGVALDGVDEESVIGIVTLAVDRFGRLDGVHLNFTNAADAYLPGGVVDLPLDAFDEVMRVNTRGFVICAKHVIPPDARRRRRLDRVHGVDRRLQRREHPGVLPDEQGRRAGLDAAHRA
jgi:NAD(P)-dependent dehydrogenase (short-subunit alcohol dehydrogenase family)